jgi:PIN domain nuclease of toxin-antitoxin system
LNLLLDTVTAIRASGVPHLLSRTALDAVEDPRNRIVISAASAWEMATKFRLGRLPGAEPWVVRWEDQLSAARAEELAVTSRHALRAGSFPADHRDPFDRILAAQAMVEDLVLVTPDPAFEAFPVAVLW